MSKVPLLIIILIMTLPVGIPARREQPRQKHQSRWSLPSLSPFPCWDLQLLIFLPLPCLKSAATARRWSGAERVPVAVLGELPCTQRSCPNAWRVCVAGELLRGGGLCGVPRLSRHVRSAWGSAGFKAWQESGWKLRWERFLDTLKWTPCRVFSALSTEWDLCCLYFLRLESLNSFGVLVGLLPSVSPWSIRSTSGFCCLRLCCVTVGGCWKHLRAALGDGLDEH